MANKEKETKSINKKEKNVKDKKSFFKSFKGELKKVSWPTPKQLVNNTVAVVVIVLVIALIVFVLDLAFDAANKYGIDKIKESVVSTSDENETEEGENQENSEGSETTEQEGTIETQEVPTEVTTEQTETPQAATSGANQ